MKITDKEVIEYRTIEASKTNDGLIVFVRQGAYVIDMCAYSGKEPVILDGRESTRPYDLFEITIIPHREGVGEIFNYSHLDSAADISNYDVRSAVIEYYDNAVEAHARFAMLIAEMNHF